MRRYCLSYAIRKPVDADSNRLGIEIAKILIEAGAINLESPLPGTIIFDDQSRKNNFTMWKGLIKENLATNAFYYLCSVAATTDKAVLDTVRGNPDLMEDFRNEISTHRKFNQ